MWFNIIFVDNTQSISENVHKTWVQSKTNSVSTMEALLRGSGNRIP